MDDKGKWGDRMMFFLFGGMIGATVALLFAPRSGEETREFISSRVREGCDAVGEGLRHTSERLTHAKHQIEDEARDLLAKGKRRVNREKELISAAIEAGKQAYKEERESAKGDS